MYNTIISHLIPILELLILLHYWICISASQIWELAKDQDNTMDFAEAIDNSDLESFGFTDDFIFELWGAVTDAKSGRLAAATNLGEF